MIKDSGNRTAFESGALRDIQEGKGRCDLLPLDIIDLWCDDGLQGTLYYVGKYLKCKDNTDYFELILNQFAEEHQAKRIAAGENVNNKLYSLEEYRWNLVLELAKHFEEGAKKYGDRNWEKGIPCDRYIDSAVRHYCKWRAEWDDEPHDRAFIWNVVCCEWTRQQYGWNLERLETAKKKDQEIDENSDIKAVLETISECEYNTEPLKTLIDYVEKTLKVQERHNPCVKDTDTGWHFYDIDGRLVAYIFDFKEPEEGKRRQLGRMLHKVWREVTGNPYTIKRIVEEWGYICGRDFSICIAPSEAVKEYDLRNRKYNEED